MSDIPQIQPPESSEELSYEETIEWATDKWRRYQHTLAGGSCIALEFDRPLKQEPLWHTYECERQYRKGYTHGMADTSRIVAYMFKRGYVRIKEILNVLDSWLCNDIMEWKKKAWFHSHDEDAITSPPTFDCPLWSTLKAQIRERDNNRCVTCGSDIKICVDHIHPIRSGGLPIPDNLQTLCGKCHLDKTYGGGEQDDNE